MSHNVPRPDRKSHRLSPAVYASVELIFSFTVCARPHSNPFFDEGLAKIVVDSLLWTRKRYGWKLSCYCLMPDHLHFVCRLSRETPSQSVNRGVHGNLPEGVLDHLARFKSFTTHEAWNCGIEGRLWQKSSYDRVMDLAWPIEEVILYTLENPQRAGLVKDWREWPYARIVDPWWE